MVPPQRETPSTSPHRGGGAIPADEYARIITFLPILCVDLVLCDRDGRYLLGKRTNEPLKGEWWVVGGRVQIGETVEAAACRKLREELGLEVDGLERLGIYEDVFERNSFGVDALYHTVSIVFRSVIHDPQAIRLDAQHDSWKFSDALPPRLVIQPFAGARTFLESE